MEENPWKIRSKQTIYENKWLRLDEHAVTNPAGNPGIYGTVHFKQLAIGILPLADNGDTWLVGQYRFPLKEYSWEIPEGGGALDIEPLESARRELLEETGLVATEWTPLAGFVTSNSVTDERAILFIARGLTEKESHPDEEEKLEIKRLPFLEAFQMAMDGRITDSLTLVALMKARLLMLEDRL